MKWVHLNTLVKNRNADMFNFDSTINLLNQFPAWIVEQFRLKFLSLIFEEKNWCRGKNTLKQFSTKGINKLLTCSFLKERARLIKF